MEDWTCQKKEKVNFKTGKYLVNLNEYFLHKTIIITDFYSPNKNDENTLKH